MKDLIAEKTSGLFVEVGKVIEHMKAQQARIADLERQLAEASAPAVEQQPEWEDFDIEKTGDDHFDAGNFLLNAAKQFWSACHKAKQYGAVQWLLGENGELLIFTRGEYKSTLLNNIEMYGPTKHFKEPQAADTGKVREAILSILPNPPASLDKHESASYCVDFRAGLKAAAELVGSMAAQAPVREVPDERLQNWIDLIHDNERSMGDRLQSLSSTFAGLLNGDAVDKYPLRAIREQLEGEPLNAILCPDSWHKVADHGNPPEGLYMAIYKGDGRSLPVALLAYGEYEFEVESDDDDRHVGEIGWAEYSENSDGDYCMVIREVIAYLPVNLDMESLKAIRAALPAAPVQQEGGL